MLCGIGGIIGILIGTGGSLLVGRLMFQMTIYPAAWITAVRLHAVGGAGNLVRHLSGGKGRQAPACGSTAGGMRGRD